jgi:hypothetical protein
LSITFTCIGDVNGDGVDDLVIGAPGSSASGGGVDSSGTTYVFFGRASSFDSSFDISKLDADTGFAIYGIATNNFSGSVVSAAGDMNVDGVDDVLIGSRFIDNDRGAAYVVFGSTKPVTEPILLSSLDGKNGFSMRGIGAIASGRFGMSVSNVGDVNADGAADILIGAPKDGSSGFGFKGAAYLVFGSSDSFASELTMNSLNGKNGVTIPGEFATDHRAGTSVSGAGDINGDGISDFIIGAPRNSSSTSGDRGTAYVVFGNSDGFSASINLSGLTGTNGFQIKGPVSGVVGDLFGASVSAAGDFNGDGLDDVAGGSGSEGLSTQIIYGISSREGDTTLFSSVLPSAKSGYDGGPDITVFSSVINATSRRADNCRFSIPAVAPVSLHVQTTNAVNVSVGPLDPVFLMNPGEIKNFILAFTPTALSAGEEVFPQVACGKGEVSRISGVNTVFLSIDNEPVPDILSIVATVAGNGVVSIPSGGTAFMTASATNIGVGDNGGSLDAKVSVSVDDGGAGLPLQMLVCETDALSICMDDPAPGVVSIINGGPSFFAVFFIDQSSGGVALDPANKRVFLRFTAEDGTVRSVTSAAVTVE